MRGYYFITDAALSRAGNAADVKAALAARVRFIQYRNKDASTREMLGEARELKSLCRNALFLVNDRVDVGLAVNADGVHLGQEDLPYDLARRLLGRRKIIGLTVHSLHQAREAQRWGANYVGVSPVFATRTKQDAGSPVGLELLRRISRALTIPVIAIGGITLENAPLVIEAGADGLCAISAVVTRPSARREMENFQRLFQDCHYLHPFPVQERPVLPVAK